MPQQFNPNSSGFSADPMLHSALINVMVKAARRAGRSLKHDLNEIEHLQVSLKGPANFVSLADKRAEEMLYTDLAKARPGYGFIGEEGGAREGSDKSHTWIVDPLDGTTNFLHGIPQFAISIALQADRNRELRDAVQEVGGAVERIDDPGVALVLAFAGAAFFADEAVTRARLGEVGVQHLLGAPVGHGDEIGRSLQRHLEMFDLAEVALEAAAGAARGLDHDVDDG